LPECDILNTLWLCGAQWGLFLKKGKILQSPNFRPILEIFFLLCSEKMGLQELTAQNWKNRVLKVEMGHLLDSGFWG